MTKKSWVAGVVVSVCGGFLAMGTVVYAQNASEEAGIGSFQIEEATIDDMHRAIQDGRTEPPRSDRRHHQR